MRVRNDSFSVAKHGGLDNYRKQKTTLDFADDEIIVDLFAGGGGASLGIEWALGRSPDIAINHDPEAVAMHTANHPNTEHWIEDVRDVDPVVVCRGRKVGLLWASPDCTEHSRAKNGALVRDKKVRGLAWVVIDWAKLVRPRVIMLENVMEWEDWGPLGPDGKIDKDRMGEHHEDWCRRLEGLGYKISKNNLAACDYGAPTSRKRLYLIARCDGVDPAEDWPDPTHGPSRAEPYHTAAECIDYTLPCPSIFMTKAEAKAFTKATGIKCKRPLVDKTMARIRRGIFKYVIGNARPFIVPVSHGSKSGPTDERVHDSADPLRTVTGANRGELAVVQPFLSSYYGESPDGYERDRGRDLSDPMHTATTANRFGLVTPLVAPVKSWGGGGNEAAPADRPMRTITTSKRGEFGVVAPYLARTAHGETSAKGNRRGKGAHAATDPVPTVCASSVDFALVAPTLVQTGYSERPEVVKPDGTVVPGQAPRCLDLHKPLGVIPSGGTGGNGKHALVSAFLSMGYSERDTGGEVGSKPIDQPASSITTRDHHNLVLGHMVKFRGTSDEHVNSSAFPAEGQVPTISANGNHVGEVRAFLSKYYGNGTPENLAEPLDTVTTKDRFGLVMVEGVEYQIVDIGMRMLEPRELYRAQGFPDSYIIDPVVTRTFRRTIKRGKRAGQVVERTVTKPLTETQQVEKCGNSVSPPMAAALVRSVFATREMRSAA